ncbi:MAG: DNA translocase FtsK [Nitrospirae bacterium]|nr:DNA translocase FtsK [Nitrospirota bacterium]
MADSLKIPYFKTSAEPEHGIGRRLQEIKGVMALGGGIYLALSLFSYNKWERSFFTYSQSATHNYGGIAGAYVSDAVISFLGLSGYIAPVLLLIYGIRQIIGKERNVLHMLGTVVLFASFSMLAQLVSGTVALPVDPAGGFAGLVMADFFEGLLSQPGAYILGAALAVVALILLSPVSIFSFLTNRENQTKREQDVPPQELPLYPVENEEVLIESRPSATKSAPKAAPLPKVKRDDGYMLPSLDFLKDVEGVSGPGKDELNALASGIERKLADFGVNGKIKGAHPGPVVTMYEFEPAAGVKINRIVSLSEDLALALRAPSIRVYPIAGKATIGIEVPNRQRATVALKDIVAAENFQHSTSLLTLALGKDIFGNPVATDLSKMPHLLVAGATGSGKSVSINAMIISLLYKATPDEVKMLMIDPKLLELAAYAGIPHLISPVINSPKEASEALKKMVFEMERRYKLLAQKGSRNIDTYNRQAAENERLPYIVVIIDELADLMFTAPSDVENAITRLAQMARASGIHLILATQRPSVDVITGLIKANFPARISFQVTSRIDSRTILDGQGAEQLLGMGDMLFMIPGVKLLRIHGAYVTETEIKTITEFVKSQGAPDYTLFESLVVPEAQDNGSDVSGERDELYHKAADFAEAAGEVSISSIQRRFKIGYNRAASIMELFEEDGLVGPPKGAGKPRDFLGRRG